MRIANAGTSELSHFVFFSQRQSDVNTQTVSGALNKEVGIKTSFHACMDANYGSVGYHSVCSCSCAASSFDVLNSYQGVLMINWHLSPSKRQTLSGPLNYFGANVSLAAMLKAFSL